MEEIISPSRKDLNLLDTDAVNFWFKKNQPTMVILQLQMEEFIKYTIQLFYI